MRRWHRLSSPEYAKGEKVMTPFGTGTVEEIAHPQHAYSVRMEDGKVHAFEFGDPRVTRG